MSSFLKGKAGKGRRKEVLPIKRVDRETTEARRCFWVLSSSMLQSAKFAENGVALKENDLNLQ